MKRVITALAMAAMLAVPAAQARMSAFFSYCTFNQPKGKPFIETYLTVIGSTVTFSPNADNKYQSTIEVQWVLKKNDAIVFFDKYNLHSPEVANLSSALPNFLDQQRIPADAGNYTLELTINDKNSYDSRFTASESIDIRFPAEDISISDIELLESFKPATVEGRMTRNGYDLVPYISDFYPEAMESIRFYAEIYNTKALLGDDQYLVRYSIIKDNNKEVLNDLVASKKMTTSDVGVLLAELPLAQVYSGNYELAIEVRDRKNEVRARKSIFFQRSFKTEAQTPDLPDDFTVFDVTNTFVASMTSEDTLKDYIACLYPISGASERQVATNQMTISSVKSMQQYFYYFWLKQDRQNPGEKWQEYKAEVDKVNAAYSTRNSKGYDSDRGRVYLQYGPPNSMEQDENDPNSYPYEIWHYYKIGNQSNKKFVFYSRDRSSNDYLLLHSDVTGEPSAYDWQLKLHEKTTQFGPDIDADKAPKTYGDRSEDLFKNPR